MLHTNIENQISKEDQLVLQCNQNYFIRTAIANVAKVILATAIYTGLLVLIINISAANAASSKSDAEATIVFLVLSSLVYIVYFFATVSEVVGLYKQSTNIENQILGTSKSAATKKTPTKSTTNNIKDDSEDDL